MRRGLYRGPAVAHPQTPPAAPARVSFRPFSRESWACYNGAERFPSGAEPLIATIKVDGIAADVIVDAAGLSIFWCTDDADSSADVPRGEAFRALALLEAEMTTAGLRAIGFLVCGPNGAER